MLGVTVILIEFAKGITAIVLLGTIWLLVQTAHRRQQCRMDGSADDGELPNCSGCHRISRCQRTSESSN